MRRPIIWDACLALAVAIIAVEGVRLLFILSVP
jgi:hypothetical protein